MEAIEELSQLADLMRQASALLADEDVDESGSSSSSRRSSTFLNVVTLGNVVSSSGLPNFLGVHTSGYLDCRYLYGFVFYR